MGMRVFAFAGCPFAHRTLSLLTHLGVGFERREIDLANKPADFLALSPTGKVPLLEDEGFVLYESAVINEYLAERFEWSGFSSDVRERARERLAIVQFDQVIAAKFYGSLKAPGAELEPGLVKEIDRLAEVVEGKPVASLLGFHLAPFWLRWNWIEPEAAILRRMRSSGKLAEWLDRAVEQKAVATHAPERELTVRQTRARFGLD